MSYKEKTKHSSYVQDPGCRQAFRLLVIDTLSDLQMVTRATAMPGRTINSSSSLTKTRHPAQLSFDNIWLTGIDNRNFAPCW